MAYRFDGLSGRALFDGGLLWEYEDLLNYQFFSVYTPNAFVDNWQNTNVSQTGFAAPKPQVAEPNYIEKRVVSEGPVFLPPIAQNDTIAANSLITIFNLFADNGFGADTDPDGDPLTITQINGIGVTIGQQVTLNNGLLVTNLGNGEVQFSTVGLNSGDIATDTFTYTVDDGNGETGSATVNVSFGVIAIDLSAIPAGFGTRLFGAVDGDFSGTSVSNLGDVNGDGVDDFILGAPGDDTAGAAIVVFGNAGGLGDNFDLSTLDGTNGFRIDGIGALDSLGFAVSDAGDLNGDGINDILIGAAGAGPQNAFGVAQGEAYVIFGTNAGFPANFDLTTLDGTNGFSILSRSGDVRVGVALSFAGDINDDGFDDVLVGSQGDGEFGDLAHAFVIYGSNAGFGSSFDLGQLDGANGFVISALALRDGTGQSVTGLGDIDGDGIDDFAVGAPGADGAFGNSSFTGEVYVIMGNAAGFGTSFDLSTLNGPNGFVINAIATTAGLGTSVSNIGDVNGDGLADILISAPDADNSAGLSAAGQAYVIYGSTSFAGSLDLSTLNGLNGFAVDGVNQSDLTGFNVSGIGDFNGDGVDDFIISAIQGDPNGNNAAGQTYVLFGGNFGANAVFDLTTLDGTNGFALFGGDAFDFSGEGVSGAGDVNGDGFADLLIGAPGANDFGNGSQGESYILYGFDPVAAGNNPPVANDDAFTIDEDSNFSGDLFVDNGSGEDTDPDGDNFFVSLINGAAFTIGDIYVINGGTVTITGNGTFDFTTDGNFEALGVGETSVGSLTYTINDGNGGTATATATVTVTGVNDAPVGFDPGTGLPPANPLDYIPAQNSLDGATVTNLALSPFFVDPDTSDTLTITVGIVDLPPGLFFNQATNTIEGTATSSASQGGPNNDGVYTVQVTATDQSGISFVTNVVFNLTNPAPVAENDSLTTNEATVINGDVFAANGVGVDADVDGDTFVVSLVNGSIANVGLAVAGSTGGLFTILADGTFSFDPDGDFDALNTGDSNDTTITYTIDDGEGGTSTATVTITVTGVNAAGSAPSAQDDVLATDEDTAINGSIFADNGSGADSDADGDVFTVTEVGGVPANVGAAVAGTSGGLFTINDDGSYIFDPNGDFEGVATGATVTTTITYTIDDIVDGQSTATVTVTVTGVNDVPIAQGDAFTTDEATAVAGNVLADNGAGVDSDPEGGAFTVSLVNGSGANVGLAIAGSAGGLFTILADGTFSFDPDGDFDALNTGDSNNTTVTYTVLDEDGGTSTATVTVTVNGVNAVNNPPVASNDAFATDEDNAVAGNVFDDNGSGADEDLDGDIFTVTMVGGSAANVGANIAGSDGGLFSISSNGMFNFQPNGDFDSLAVGETATSTVTYTIDDGNGGTSTATATVTITGVNDAPLALDDILVGGPDSNTFNLLADNGNGADSDPNGDTLVVTEINGIAVQPGADVVLQSGLTVHFNGVGEIELRTLQPGIYNETFTYTVSDGNGGTSTATVTTQFIVDSVDLAAVNQFGLTINGVAAGDESGFAVSAAGDINNDGFADFMIGAHFAGPNANGDPGATYVIFGGPNGPAPAGQDFNLSDIDGTNGFVLTGIDQFDNSGWSIAAPGDINGDGIDDMLISGHLADTNGGQSGEAYVVFGGQSFGVSFDLGSLNGTNGFVINGIDAVDQAGYEVAGVGDINDDGINDFIIGARGADTDGDNHTGEAYVVFGSAGGFDAAFELADLNGTNGFTIVGVTAEGFLGAGLAAAPGDFDGDGISDALIGIPGIDGEPGQALILFGDGGGFGARVDVGNLASAGILIDGIDPTGQAGFDLTGLGDINGDGIDDFAIAAPFANPAGSIDAGEIYIVFGGAGIRNGVDLSALDGTNGFVISGADAGINLGFSVASAGDFDGDGINDFLIGAPSVNGSGGAVLLYGRASAFSANFDIDGLNGNDGFYINGIALDDDAGFAVTGIGDIDGDGRDDLLIGAPGVDANGNADSGQSYVLPGFARVGPTLAEVTGKNIVSDVFTGDGSGNNNQIVSELPPTDKPIISDDDSFVFVEKTIVSDDVMGLNTEFGDFVIDQDVMAEFLTYAQTLALAYLNPEQYLELDHASSESTLSYHMDFFNFL